jgi:hypothetical protein
MSTAFVSTPRPWFVVGARLEFDFGLGKRANKKYEVRALVDDEYCVVRRYVRRGNKGWVYELMHESYLATTYRAGNLSVRHDG